LVISEIQSPTTKPKPAPPGTPKQAATPAAPKRASCSSSSLSSIAAEVARKKAAGQQRQILGSAIARARAKKSQQVAHQVAQPPVEVAQNKTEAPVLLSFANTMDLAVPTYTEYTNSPAKAYVVDPKKHAELDDVEKDLKKIGQEIATGVQDFSDKEKEFTTQLISQHEFLELTGEASAKQFEDRKDEIHQFCKRKREGLEKVGVCASKELLFISDTLRPSFKKYGEVMNENKRLKTEVEKNNKILDAIKNNL
jgi:hypothetical protein